MQGDQRQEQADTGSNRRTQGQGDGIDDPFADAEDRQQEKQHGRDKYRTQRHLPGMAQVQDHGVGKEGVQAHARCQGNRVVGDQTHDRRADGRCQTGGDKQRALVHAGLAENARVDEQDVGHGQECRDTGQNLGTHVSVVCLELKQLFQHACSLWRIRRRDLLTSKSKHKLRQAPRVFYRGSEKAAHHTSRSTTCGARPRFC